MGLAHVRASAPAGRVSPCTFQVLLPGSAGTLRAGSLEEGEPVDADTELGCDGSHRAASCRLPAWPRNLGLA